MKMWNPYVRFARMNETFIIQGILQAIDHRIFYCHRGKGQIEANGQLYSFTAGTLIYLPAKTPYRYIFNQEIPVFSGCNFDFYQDHADLNTPIPPVAQSHFRTENILEPQILDGEDIFSQTLCLENVFQFEEKFIEIAQEFENHNLYFDIRCSTLLKDVLIQTARLATTKKQKINPQKANAILQYIHSHYQDPLTNKDLAERFNYHKYYISSLILKYTGLPLHQYVLNYRMHIAVALLQSTNMSIREVAEKVGMPDIKHFSKCFKKFIGHSPSQFKVK